MTSAFVNALLRQGFTLAYSDHGQCRVTLGDGTERISVVASASAAVIEVTRDAETFTVMLSGTPDEVAVRIVELLRG